MFAGWNNTNKYTFEVCKYKLFIMKQEDYYIKIYINQDLMQED